MAFGLMKRWRSAECVVGRGPEVKSISKWPNCTDPKGDLQIRPSRKLQRFFVTDGFTWNDAIY